MWFWMRLIEWSRWALNNKSVPFVIRPDVQLVLFSATFPPRIVQMAVDLMESPVRVAVGKTGMANKQIQQEIYVLKVRLMDSSHV